MYTFYFYLMLFDSFGEPWITWYIPSEGEYIGLKPLVKIYLLLFFLFKVKNLELEYIFFQESLMKTLLGKLECS